MSHHVLEITDLQYVYPDGNKAINEISFKLHHGESVGIVGANGAGKSTLLMLILGIIFPVHGNISIGNIPVTKKTLPHIREKVGMVFQDPDDQLFMNTVYDDVAFGPRNYKIDEEEVSKRVLKALETVGILHLKDRAPYKLSGGEKRSVSIATVLSMHPEILIMDEPSTALDPKSRRCLIDSLKSFDHTKIIATHDLDMVFELCERTIILKEGAIVSDGLTSELMINQEFMEKCNLEIPLSIQNCPRCGAP
jgi:cobalt/nickel transport system ATP-binding protein